MVLNKTNFSVNPKYSLEISYPSKGQLL